MSLSLILFRNNSSRSVTVGPGRFTVINDSASLKMVIKIYFNLFLVSLKVLELTVQKADYQSHIRLLIGTTFA